MSHQHSANRDRVSPRRRFHRPAAEFLGARRQVPVLTGLPRIGDEDKQPEEEPATPEPDIVEQVLAPATEEPTVNIREAGTHLREVSDPWREWAYPIGGILIASLLCYTAWVGIHNPNIRSEKEQVAEEAPVPEFVPVQVAEAPVDSVSVAPVVEEAPALQNSFNQQFLQQPFQEPPTPPKSTEFVQRDVLEWDNTATAVASKPEEPQLSSPSFVDVPTQSDVSPEDEPGDIHDALPLLSNESDDIGSDLDYPSTGFDQEFPAPQANAGGNGIDLAELAPPQSTATPELGPDTEPLMPTTSNSIADIGSTLAQPGTVASPFTNSAHPAHVVVNPHFQPTQVPATNNVGASAAFETARAMPQSQGMTLAHPQQPAATPQYAQSSYAAQPAAAPATNKSIYGSFPVTGPATGPANTSSIPTAVEQARLNGSIEPFPRSN